ncbi:hypothetical protein HDK90DRAFT_465426 [Phyllosticta capitalensis]|uniref:Nephrocystin 3-like N-terminal domain-containing protein n=1 Tax=Phyllosticta capitalensis TaxID=121624 RepID=A0ABR1YVD9_9PEZI
MGSTPDPPDGDMTYEEMWAKAIEEYYKAAGYENKEFFYEENEVEIKAEIEKVKKIAQASGPPARCRDVVWNFAPQAINVALQGASIAFPPAAIIGTVTNLFAKAGKEYNELFNRMEGFRGMIQFYFEELDRRQEHERSGQPGQPHLKAIDFQRLCCHLKICGYITRYAKRPDHYHDEIASKGHELEDKNNEPTEETKHKKRNVIKGLFRSEKPENKVEQQFGKARKRDKAMLFFEVLTGSNDIDKEFNTIEELTAKYNEARNSDAYRDMKTLMKDSQNRSEKDFLEKFLDTIKSSLNIQDDHRSWTALHSKLSPVAGMGDWIMESDLFKSWSNFDVPCKTPLLRLEGPEKYGKTFLCHRVISHLQDNKQISLGKGAVQGFPTTPSRLSNVLNMTACVAYFYFGKGGSDEKDKATLRDAIAAIIWQLVQDDVLYRQFVAKRCSSIASPMKKEELWALLRPRTTSRFFIVLDGVDHAAECEDHLKNLISKIASGTDTKDRLRIMLSGTLQSLACIENQGSAIDLSDTEETRQDVNIFIKHVLNSQMQPIAGDPEEAIDRSNLPEDPTETLLGILTEVRNYDFIDFLLGKMSKGFFPDARLKELADELTAGGEFALVKFQTQHLNQVLQPSDIENFNQILPWLVLPNNSWPVMKQIEDVLAIHHDGQRPLLKIKAYISQTFGDLVEVDKQVVCSNSINGYYRDIFKITLESSVPDSAKQMNRALENEALHPSEIALVERFLQTVCGEPLYNKFGFDKFFKDKKDPPPGLIEFNPIDAHIKMITTCLKAACSRKRDEYESIHKYTTRWLPWHLSEIHPDMLSTSQVRKMADVMPLLCQFFSERDVVEAWFKPEWTEESLEGWFSAEKQPDCAMRWINDLSFAKIHEVQAPQESFDWLALDKSHPRWRFFYFDSCQWIVSYLNELQQSGTGRLDQEWPPSVESILDAERWAQKALNTVQDTADWNLRVVVSLALWHPQEALKRLHWVASNALEKTILPRIFGVYVIMIELFPDCHVEALEILQPLFDDFKLRSHEYETLIQSHIMQCMGIVYSAAGKGPEAVECFKRSLECVPSDGEREIKLENIHLLLDSLLRTGQHEEVVNTLLALNSDDLIELVGKFKGSEFRGKIAMAVTKSGSPDSRTIFQRALDEYEEKDQSQAVIIAGDGARIFQALILSWTRVQSDLDAAIQLWQAVLHHPKKDRSNTRLSYYEKQAETQLSRAFYLKAKKSGQQDISDEDRTTYFRSSFGTEGVSDNAWLATKALHVARFHKLCGRKDAAKKELKRKLLYVKDILSDDDDSNDFKGYKILAQVLTCLDQDDDARMAFMLHFGYNSESDPASSAANHTTSRWWCDGFCGTTWNGRLLEDFYYCKDCLSLSFDKRCKNKYLEGSLGFNMCGKDHKFLCVPKWGEESARELKERVPDVKKWKDSVLKSLLGDEDEGAESEVAGDVKDGAEDDSNDHSDALQQ